LIPVRTLESLVSGGVITAKKPGAITPKGDTCARGSAIPFFRDVAAPAKPEASGLLQGFSYRDGESAGSSVAGIRSTI